MHRLTGLVLFFAIIFCGLPVSAQYFIANMGQWDGPFLYKLEYRSAAVYVRKDGLRFHLQDPSALAHFHNEKGQHKLPDGPVKNHAFDLLFQTAVKKIEGNKDLQTYHNYYLGKDRSKWRSEVPLSSELEIIDLYPGIDLFLKASTVNLKYDLVINPGANPSQIEWKYAGVDALSLENGRLIIQTSVGRLVEEAPVAWQMIDGNYLPVDVAFKLNGRLISFELGEYDAAHKLIIDPNYIFSTYTGSTADNFGYTATFDLQGNTYAGGIVFNNGYPVDTGAFQTSFAGGVFDCSISKFNTNGTQLLYSTYLGGGQNEQPHSMVVDTSGHLIVLGVTGSPNFPVSATAFDTTFNGGPNVNVGWAPFSTGVDIFITKFSADGDSLIGSTYLGGTHTDGANNNLAYNYGDAARGEVIVDLNGDIYFASSSRSNDFPVSTNAYQANNAGLQDAVVGKMNGNLSQRIWATYLGGIAHDAGYSLKRNVAGNKLFVAGGTRSQNFPVDVGAYQSSIGGNTDGFITSFNPSNGSYINSTFNGTVKYDQNFFISLDLDDAVYVFGQTRGQYPVSPGVWYIPHSTQYIHKLNGNLTQSLRSTVFGSGDSLYVNISPTALMVDVCKSVYISGWGGNVNNEGSTVGMPITPNAFDTITDGSDFYFMVLDGSWKFIEYGSYFGGQGSNEHVDGGTSRFSPAGIIHQAVCAGCSGTSLFPAFPSNVWSTTNNSFNCNLACLRIDFDLDAAKVDIELVPDTACLPHKLTFIDKSTNVDVMHWDFGDGTTYTGRNPNKIYDTAGAYILEIIGIDTLCNTSDTQYVPLYLVNSIINADFKADWDTCAVPYTVQLTNLSVGKVFQWDFGDGTTSTVKNPTKNYLQPGTYTIKLAVQDTFCGTWDTAYTNVVFNEGGGNVSFNVDYFPCVNWQQVACRITSGFGNYDVFKWEMGDGNSRFGYTVNYTYKQPGFYNIKLTATDTVCNNTFVDDFPVNVVQYEQLDDILPNVFTPNGDGANDNWKLLHTVKPSQFSSFRLEVYNRWGSMVFATDDPAFKWDGVFEGEDLAQTAYFWVVWYEDQCLNKAEGHGEVHIVR